VDEPSRTAPVIDPRYIVNVLMELQVAIRKLGLYSFSHTIVSGLLENLEKQFNALFEFVDTVTFGITRREILYQGSTLSTSNPVIREFARGLNQFGLAGITFSKGLGSDDLLKFLKFFIEGRVESAEQKEQRLSRLHDEVPSIRLKMIRFGDALKGSQSGSDSADEPNPEKADTELWRGLVRQLMDENPEAASQIEDTNPEHMAELGQMAELINRLCRGRGGGSQSYERTIVKYLNKQSEDRGMTAEQRIQLNRELSKMLSNLQPEIREQVFRISMEEAQGDEAPLEELLDFLPEQSLMEVLNQIQLSDQAISAPMLGLLNKFTDLSVQNKILQEMLNSKLENHQELYQELLTYRANRAYYPSSYRSLLDGELALQDARGQVSILPELGEIEPVAVRSHLAQVILELLDGPIQSQTDYEGLLHHMNRLLAEGMGEKTPVILQETLMLILQKTGTAVPEFRPFLQKELRNFIKPEVLASLLQTYRTQGDEQVGDLFGQLRELAGADVIPMLLDLLETEENLSVRKRLLGWIVQCGPDVIPLAIQRLKNPKWYVVRNMLVLLKDLRAKEALPEIARCMQKKSSKLRLAALQAMESLGRGMDSYYQAVSIGLEDEDPTVFRKAVSMMLSQKDARAMQLITAQLEYSGTSKSDGHLIAVLEMIRKSGVKELIPVLVKLRRRLVLRFWQWNRTRSLYRAVKETVRELHMRERKYA
jgi:hypothetical protein